MHRDSTVIEVKRAAEADYMHYIDVYCPDTRTMAKEEGLRYCNWWADYNAYVFYMKLYRRLGDEVFTALVDGEVVGDIYYYLAAIALLTVL